MLVGTLQLKILIRSSHSLKEKRMVVKSLKDRLQNKFNISIAETDYQDVWQTAGLGIAMAGSDAKFIAGTLTKIIEYVRLSGDAELMEHEMEIL